jgi:hypothetical protein
MPSIALLPQTNVIHFDEPSHRYWLWSHRRGRWMQPASTSQVLAAGGLKGFDNTFWRKSLMEKRGMRRDEADLYMELHRDNRAHIGTELHGLIRAELLGGTFRPKYAESLMLLSVWRREFLPRIDEVVLCEMPMASTNYFYTGTPDLVCKVDGLRLTVDWKSKVNEEKAKPDKSWKFQLSGYDQLTEENYLLQLDGAMNLMIWPDGCEDVFYNRADMLQSRRVFIGCLAWNHLLKGVAGCDDHRGAFHHLCRLHPDALLWTPPPPGLPERLTAWALGMVPELVAAAPR